MKKLINQSFIMIFLQMGFFYSFKSPDIIVDSRFTSYWSKYLVNKARILIKNYGLKDPLASKINEEIKISQSLATHLSSDSMSLFQDFSKAIGIDLIRGQTFVSIKGFSYNIDGFYADLVDGQEFYSSQMIEVDLGASALNATFDHIKLSLELPLDSQSSSAVASIDLLGTSIKASSDHLINLRTKFKLLNQSQTFDLKFLNADFSQMIEHLKKDPSLIELNLGTINVSDISLQVGSSHLNIKKDKLRNYILDKKDELKALLVAKLTETLKDNSQKILGTVFNQLKIDKEYWLESEQIYGQFFIENMKANIRKNNLELSMPADFCPEFRFRQLKKECLNKKVSTPPPSRMTPKLHELSRLAISGLNTFDDAEMVISFSEDYVNKLLLTLYDAGVWNESLESAGVELGPNKMMLRLDKEGRTGTLYLDVVYNPTRLYGFVLGTDVVRFPVVMEVSLSIESRNKIPVVNVKFENIDLSDETLLYGKSLNEGYVNFPSTLQKIRFKKKVLGIIRTSLATLTTGENFKIEFPELKNLGLERVHFSSDGLGRMNAFLRYAD